MSEVAWYLAENGQQVGPMSLEDLISRLRRTGPQTLVYGPGLGNWQEASTVPLIAQQLASGSGGFGGATPPPPPPRGRRSDQIDYEIFGSEMQYAEITLDPGETAIAEPGGLFYMTAGIEMQTHFGDPSQQGGLLSKLKTAGKRMLTGESMFMTTYTNNARGRETVAFAAPYPGKLVPMHLDQLGGELICQKDSFLCAAKGVQIGIAFQKKIGVALFGGEGFIMQRLTGDGVALVHAGGTLLKRTLAPGEQLRVDTGCLVALMPSVQYDIQFVGGIKNTIFGGEGLFYAVLSGPGDIWLQSLPFSRLAGRMLAGAGSGKGEGSVLGGIGRIFDGDNR
jgi:uncharacterized protein (TIGR00266 family)